MLLQYKALCLILALREKQEKFDTTFSGAREWTLQIFVHREYTQG
jgi:hypothetical protein